MNELAPFDARVAGLLLATGADGRRQLARAIATRLRASQSKRIGAQLNPDGTPYAPRKLRLRAKRGSLRRPMFSKLRTARYMKAEASPESAVVGFVAQVQRMAQVHHHGLRDRVNGRRGPEITYQARQLLGMTNAEIADVEDAVLSHLAR